MTYADKWDILPPRPVDRIGHIPPNREWGYVAKCPYCSAKNIKRVTKGQITCGALKCRAARRAEKAKLSKV
jgi:DNA-binding transcriptional regulator YdaS (Cro superfamily)